MTYAVIKCMLQANEWNDAIESVLDWIPLAEQNLVFRSVPTNEQDLVEFISSHEVRHTFICHFSCWMQDAV